MRSLLLFFITLAGFSGPVLAQDKAALEAARVEMIRQAVNFYAVDTVLTHGIAKAECQAGTVADLKACANGMEGVSGKVDSWVKSDLPDMAALNALAERIKTEVKSKPYRERMPQYQTMVDGIDHTLKSLAGAVSQPVTPPADTAKSNTIAQATPAGPITPASTKSWTDGLSIWMILALLLSAAALAKSFLVPQKKGDGGGANNSVEFRDALSKDTANREVNARLAEMDAELRKMNEMYLELQDNFNRRLRQLQHNMEAPVQEWSSAGGGNNVAPVARVRYAKTADGNGFDAASLSDEPDNKKIFEITTDASGQQATYRVAGNREAQLFALSNMNVYLRDACDYSTNPDNMNSTITTSKPGRLELQGGRWKIVSKAQISFS